MRFVGFIAVVVTGSFLLYAVSDLPDWGDPGSPANSSPISQYFIENGYEDTKAPNIVTAVLADYRGYDTMFETVVIFTAGIAILAILRGLPVTMSAPRRVRPVNDNIIQTTCRLIIPVIQLFALYVLAHGHYSPGGGFQGGVIMGASFILYALSGRLSLALKRFSEKQFLFLSALGVLVFAAFGAIPIYLGGNFLDYSTLHEVTSLSPVKARYWSILGVEIGVALTVSATMFAIYSYLSSRGALEQGL